MNIEKYMDNYLDKLDSKYKVKVKKLSCKLAKPYDSLTRIVDAISSVIGRYNDWIIRWYKLARYTTIPLNKLWVRSWLNSIKSDMTKTPFDEKGIHFFYARQGGGKSSIMFHIIKADLYKTGLGAYLATNMEKPKYDEKGKYVYHRLITNLKDFFDEKEQQMAFDTEHFNKLVIDELFALFNNRNNKAREYNDVFIGFVTSLVQMRHQEMDYTFLSSQQLSSDVQLMGIVNYYHKVKAIKRFDYRNWLRTGQFKIDLVGWKVKSYDVEHLRNDFKLHLNRSWFYPNIYGLEDFESLNMRGKYEGMKKDSFVADAKYRYASSIGGGK